MEDNFCLQNMDTLKSKRKEEKLRVLALFENIER